MGKIFSEREFSRSKKTILHIEVINENEIQIQFQPSIRPGFILCTINKPKHACTRLSKYKRKR